MLLFSAFAMAATGVALPLSPQVLFVLAVAFLGTMNPSSGDIGMFVPLEHSMLAHGAADAQGTHVFARYSLIGALASAGALVAAAPDGLVRFGLGAVPSLQLMFYVYAVLGLIAAGFYWSVPRALPDEATPRATPLGPSRGIVHRPESTERAGVGRTKTRSVEPRTAGLGAFFLRRA